MRQSPSRQLARKPGRQNLPRPRMPNRSEEATLIM
jgi:hypothetical protein